MARRNSIEPVIEKIGDTRYRVESSTEPGVAYEVQVENGNGSCTCPAGQRGRFCKHKRAVYQHINLEQRQTEAAMVQSELPLENVPKPRSEDSKAKLTKLGYRLDEVTSALQKEIRGGR